jgi:hypothetical protein
MVEQDELVMSVKLIHKGAQPLVVVALMLKVGDCTTITLVVKPLAHPPLDPKTEYVVVKTGDGFMIAVFSVVLHVKLVAPVAVNVAVCPTHIEGEFMLIVGVAVMFTVVVATDVFTHPLASVPRTV